MSDKYWIIEKRIVDENDPRKITWKIEKTVLNLSDANQMVTSLNRNYRDMQIDKIIGLHGAKRGRNKDYANKIKKSIIFDKYRLTAKYADEPSRYNGMGRYNKY